MVGCLASSSWGLVSGSFCGISAWKPWDISTRVHCQALPGALSKIAGDEFSMVTWLLGGPGDAMWARRLYTGSATICGSLCIYYIQFGKFKSPLLFPRSLLRIITSHETTSPKIQLLLLTSSFLLLSSGIFPANLYTRSLDNTSSEAIVPRYHSKEPFKSSFPTLLSKVTIASHRLKPISPKGKHSTLPSQFTV